MSYVRYKLFITKIIFSLLVVGTPIIGMDISSMPVIPVTMVAKQIIKAGNILSYGDNDAEIYAVNGWPSNYGSDEWLIEFETTSIVTTDLNRSFLTENLLTLPRYIPHRVIYSTDKCADDMHAFENLEFIAQGCAVKAYLNLDALKVSDWNPGKNSYDLSFLIRNHGLSWKELCALGVSAAGLCVWIAIIINSAICNRA